MKEMLDPQIVDVEVQGVSFPVNVKNQNGQLVITLDKDTASEEVKSVMSLELTSQLIGTQVLVELVKRGFMEPFDSDD